MAGDDDDDLLRAEPASGDHAAEADGPSPTTAAV